MKTTRRNFLKGLLATAGAVAVAPIVKAEQGPQVESTALEMVLPEPETDLREAYEACKHGSLMRLDNLGLSLSSLDRATLNTGLKYGSRRESAGRLMLDTFDQWTGEHGIAAADAAPYRDAIADEYGLRREQRAGWSQNEGRVFVARWSPSGYDSGYGMIDNVGLLVDVGYVNYMAALSKSKTIDSLTDSEKKQAFMNELLREDRL